ncbi:hypothetical protein DNI29_22215 [Hymenobacter sediminis]|uniref:Qat anti-phage system QueC-like protein QatC n=1 Tax=Hymenobacter sediminis TaxID=2218621 RepID=UPI000DA6709B|nr:Qat anti-phage system QueC-like protein QatC [Hymenobacter sediminis]RPD44115.1 hypothetical protein DNI29_22215 [Hymenobacter sediminis]
MKLDLTITAPATLDADDVLRATVEFSNPRASSRQESATIVLKCGDILAYCRHASPAAFDLLFLASCVYGIDRLVERRPHSVDGWSRELSMSLPVLDTAAWQGREDVVAQLLSFLTGDYWQVEFTASPLVLPVPAPGDLPPAGIDQINLFSGGLDSLIGAIDFLKNKPAQKLLLVSHYDPNMHGPKSDQFKLAQALTAQFSQQFEWSNSIGVFLEDATPDSQENTLRSRSLLFISLAILLGDAIGGGVPIWVPENGSVSLNYPLSASRRSSCSTRTTHPRVIQDICQLADQLGLSTAISNPYEFQTKGEMVAGCADLPFLLSIVGESNSCGKRGHPRGWVRLGSSHCGVCMPCVYRRAALLGHPDPTTYGNNLEELKYDAGFQRLTTKRGQDLDACLSFLASTLTPRQIRTELLINGINDTAKLPGYTTLVGKTRQELAAWVSTCREPNLRHKAGLP